ATAPSGHLPSEQLFICARSLAILSHSKAPFSADGLQMAERMFRHNGVPSDLPPGFYKELDELTERFIDELPDGPANHSGPLPLYFSSETRAELLMAMRRGYESCSTQWCSGNARTW